MNNHHGTWSIRDYKDNAGQPAPPFALCSYCGSMNPDSFLEAIRSGCKVGGSDWKYGWPHKFYVEVPNPNPDEKRIVSWTSQGTQRTDVQWGTFPTLHLKFYSEHLKDWGPLADYAVRKEIEAATGILFHQDENGLGYTAPYCGYQR